MDRKTTLAAAALAALAMGGCGPYAHKSSGSAAAPGAAPAADDKKGECWGVNACKGKGSCGSAAEGHECGGQNACKGKGWLSLTKPECDGRKGTFKAG